MLRKILIGAAVKIIPLLSYLLLSHVLDTLESTATCYYADMICALQWVSVSLSCLCNLQSI
jgi:hypothetical protein